MLIGERFKPFYDRDRGADLGVKSWPPDAWRIGGGTVWGWLTYDLDADLLGPPGTAQPRLRNFLDAAADGLNGVLIDLDWAGTPRKALVHPDRNGHVYLLDVSTARCSTQSHSTYHHVQGRRPRDRPSDLRPGEAGADRPAHARDLSCVAGARTGSPRPTSPRTRLLYIPHNNLCQDAEPMQTSYIAGTPYAGMDVRMYAGRAAIAASSPPGTSPAGARSGRSKRVSVWSGAAVTATDLVFYGTMDGWFKAVHAKTGQELWRFKVGSGIVGQPTVYRGPDGKQCVAILSGVGGWAGAIVAGGLDPRDGTAALGFVNAMKDPPQHTGRGGMLYVFALP